MMINLPRNEVVSGTVFSKSNHRKGTFSLNPAPKRSGSVWQKFYLSKEKKDHVLIQTKARSICTRVSLSGFLEKLPAEQFLRVHRSFIIAIAKIETIELNRIMIDKTEIRLAISIGTRLPNASGCTNKPKGPPTTIMRWLQKAAHIFAHRNAK